MTSLSESCILSKLTVHSFNREKVDKAATREIDSAKNNKNGGRYVKRLFKSVPEIDAIYSCQQNAYNYHRTYSLPWRDGGDRIIPHDYYDTYIDNMSKYKQSLESTLEKVRGKYDDLVAVDMERIGQLANAQDYPSFDWFKSCFSLEVTLMPVPDKRDFRVEIGDALKADLDKLVEESKIQGKAELYKKAAEVYDRIITQCEKKDARLHDSMLESAKELSDVMDILNVHKDVDIENLSKDLYEVSQSVTTYQLRTSMNQRAALSTLAKKMLAKIDPLSPADSTDNVQEETPNYGHTSDPSDDVL